MLRSVLTSICALFVLATSLHAELKWEKQRQQFKRTPDDQSLQTAYKFTNVGKEPVTIKDIHTSCGCTAAHLDKKTYQPGETGQIDVKFSFGGRRGTHIKTIAVTVDGQEEPTQLELTVEIQDPIRLTPLLVFWRVGDPVAAKKVDITADAQNPVHIKSVTSSNPRITAKVETVKAGEHYALSVQPVDTSSKEAAELSVLTDFPADAPKTYAVHVRIK